MMRTFEEEHRKQRTPHPVSYRQRQTWGDPGTQSHGTSEWGQPGCRRGDQRWGV